MTNLNKHPSVPYPNLLVDPPEPTWRITPEQQARLDIIFEAGRRSWEQMERDRAARGGPEPYRGIRGYTHINSPSDQASAVL